MSTQSTFHRAIGGALAIALLVLVGPPTAMAAPSPSVADYLAKHPGGTPVWLMAGTMDGLKRAAASTAYSMVK